MALSMIDGYGSLRPPPEYAMNDRTNRRKQDKAALLEAAKINAGFAQALDNQSGRAMLWWILEQCAVFTQPHSANALNTAFACGKKEIGLFVIERIGSVDPAGFVRMQMEKIQNVNGSDHDGSNSAGIVHRDDDPADQSGFGNEA